MSQSERSTARRTDLDLIGKAARLHYEFGLTHRDISEMLGISRVKVTRLLGQAREIGMVQITVNSDASPRYRTYWDSLPYCAGHAADFAKDAALQAQRQNQVLQLFSGF